MSREFKIFKLLIQVAEFIGSEGRLTGVRLRFEEFLPFFIAGEFQRHFDKSFQVVMAFLNVNNPLHSRSDRLLTAELAVIGVGVTPASGIATNVPGLDVDARGFIPVDSSMATTLPGVWAAGDVAAFPLQGFSEERVTIGHWGLAMYLGKTAALAMLGRQVSF